MPIEKLSRKRPVGATRGIWAKEEGNRKVVLSSERFLSVSKPVSRLASNQTKALRCCIIVECCQSLSSNGWVCTESHPNLAVGKATFHLCGNMTALLNFRFEILSLPFCPLQDMRHCANANNCSDDKRVPFHIRCSLPILITVLRLLESIFHIVESGVRFSEEGACHEGFITCRQRQYDKPGNTLRLLCLSLLNENIGNHHLASRNAGGVIKRFEQCSCFSCLGFRLEKFVLMLQHAGSCEQRVGFTRFVLRCLKVVKRFRERGFGAAQISGAIPLHS